MSPSESNRRLQIAEGRTSAKLRNAAATLTAALIVASASSADAQTDSAAARALFSEGRKLMEAQRFEEACPKFEESLRLDHGMGTQFNLAHCWEQLGRTASAWALFLDVAAAARAAGQSERESAARARADALESKLTRLRIAVTEPSPELKVTRDGKDVGSAAWGTAMPVDPGTHLVEASAPGKTPWSQEVKVPAAARTFSVSVPALTDVPVAAEPVRAGLEENEPRPVTEPTRDAGGANGQSIAALVVGGVGIAALATGTVFALQSRAHNDEALTLCHTQTPQGERCENSAEQERWQGLVDDARREQVFGYVGFAVGGAAVITAVLLYATASDGRDTTALSIAPHLGSGDWGATVSGRF